MNFKQIDADSYDEVVEAVAVAVASSADIIKRRYIHRIAYYLTLSPLQNLYKNPRMSHPAWARTQTLRNI